MYNSAEIETYLNALFSRKAPRAKLVVTKQNPRLHLFAANTDEALHVLMAYPDCTVSLVTDDYQCLGFARAGVEFGDDPMSLYLTKGDRQIGICLLDQPSPLGLLFKVREHWPVAIDVPIAGANGWNVAWPEGFGCSGKGTDLNVHSIHWVDDGPTASDDLTLSQGLIQGMLANDGLPQSGALPAPLGAGHHRSASRLVVCGQGPHCPVSGLTSVAK